MRCQVEQTRPDGWSAEESQRSEETCDARFILVEESPRKNQEGNCEDGTRSLAR
jgi:hypothetical protein